MNNSAFEPVLVCCPTANVKNYCFEDWLENVMNFKYPNFQVFMVDNSIDDGQNAKDLNSIYRKKYPGEKRFLAIHSKTDNIPSVIERMAISHNICREYAIRNKYKMLLHLESDVFPPTSVIESLIQSGKLVVGAVYFIDEGLYRKPMLQRHVYPSTNRRIIYSHNFDYKETLGFIDGTIKSMSSVGLGCVLIKDVVFKRIPFRFKRNEFNHPDSYFSEDCFRNDIKIFADTSLICRHENKRWGIHGVDFK
jgi:hypothetical protein